MYRKYLAFSATREGKVSPLISRNQAEFPKVQADLGCQLDNLCRGNLSEGFASNRFAYRHVIGAFLWTMITAVGPVS